MARSGPGKNLALGNWSQAPKQPPRVWKSNGRSNHPGLTGYRGGWRRPRLMMGLVADDSVRALGAHALQWWQAEGPSAGRLLRLALLHPLPHTSVHARKYHLHVTLTGLRARKKPQQSNTPRQSLQSNVEPSSRQHVPVLMDPLATTNLVRIRQRA